MRTPVYGLTGGIASGKSTVLELFDQLGIETRDTDQLARAGDRHLLGHARATRMHNNYSDQVAHLWSDDGQLLLTTTQVAYFKE